MRLIKKKFKMSLLFFALLVLTNAVWPVQSITSEEFYTQRSWVYRHFYMFSGFFIFRMAMYSISNLSECICIAAGFGAYPKELESKCGHGPMHAVTAELLEKPEGHEYDFETIQNMKEYEFETCLTLRESIWHWNLCIQHWMVENIYKRFPFEKYRSVATLAFSAYWHGLHAGFHIFSVIVFVNMYIEDLVGKVLRFDNATKAQQSMINGFKLFLKFFALGHMFMAFILVDFSSIWRFYSSIYFSGFIFWAILYVVCHFLLNRRTRCAQWLNKSE
jgi:lysophospholipid acyltransferase 7